MPPFCLCLFSVSPGFKKTRGLVAASSKPRFLHSRSSQITDQWRRGSQLLSNYEAAGSLCTGACTPIQGAREARHGRVTATYFVPSTEYTGAWEAPCFFPASWCASTEDFKRRRPLAWEIEKTETESDEHAQARVDGNFSLGKQLPMSSLHQTVRYFYGTLVSIQ